MKELTNDVVANIIKVSRYGKRKDIEEMRKRNIPDIICDSDRSIYTTWTVVLAITEALDKEDI